MSRYLVLAVFLASCADSSLTKGTASALPTDTGPMGPQGPAGPAGPVGPQGAAGPRGLAGGISLHTQDGTLVGFAMPGLGGSAGLNYVWSATDECVAYLDITSLTPNTLGPMQSNIYFGGASCSGTPMVSVYTGVFPLGCYSPMNGKHYKADQPVNILRGVSVKSYMKPVPGLNGSWTSTCVESSDTITGATVSEFQNPKYAVLSGPFYWDAR